MTQSSSTRPFLLRENRRRRGRSHAALGSLETARGFAANDTLSSPAWEPAGGAST